MQNAKDYLRDIAGIRVICYFIDDIYNLVNALKRQSELIFIREKDYIQNPKPNGYRSLSCDYCRTGLLSGYNGIFSSGDTAAYHDHGSVGKYGAPCLLQETSGTQGRAGRSFCQYADILGKIEEQFEAYNETGMLEEITPSEVVDAPAEG